jgi:DNA-binding response OmpR family regulator
MNDILSEVEVQERTDEEKTRVESTRSSVLVVEDDASSRELLAEILATWGYEPIPASSAEEAELAARRQPFAVALVDVFLPGKSGTALLAHLRESYPGAVLIGMSALGDAEMSRRCKGQGADLFMEKPVRIDELAQALKSHHRSWH